MSRFGVRGFGLGAAALVGCTETSIVPKDDGGLPQGPEILLDPPALEFGELGQGDHETLSFTATNTGASTLHVTDVVIDSGLAFTVVGAPLAFDLEPGDEQVVEVDFTPMGAGDNYGSVLVVSDAVTDPNATVALLGRGAVPELKITPETYVFGDAFVPCGSSVDLELENIGNEDLVIEGMDYHSAGLLSLDPTTVPGFPVTLAPGAKGHVTVTFDAATAGSDTGELVVLSNDPRGPVTADQNGEGTYFQESTESFTEPGIPPVDVMVLIDQSGSMAADNVDDVQNGFPAFVQELQAVADWQLVLVTQESGCATGGILDPSTPNPDTLLVNNAFPGNYTNIQLTESLLQLASIALSRTGPGDCNEGFLRPGALLHVVVLSDEVEQSGFPGTTWVADYQTYVDAPEFVKVSGVLDLNRNCGDGSGPGGYIDAIAATGGVQLDICNADWGSQFAGIASEVLAGIRTYNLSDLPDPSSVVVTVNGNPTTDFSVTANNVTVNSPPVGEGDVVEISYGVPATCAP